MASTIFIFEIREDANQAENAQSEIAIAHIYKVACWSKITKSLYPWERPGGGGISIFIRLISSQQTMPSKTPSALAKQPMKMPS